jgi:hypothetical protein
MSNGWNYHSFAESLFYRVIDRTGYQLGGILAYSSLGATQDESDPERDFLGSPHVAKPTVLIRCLSYPIPPMLMRRHLRYPECLPEQQYSVD